MSRSSGPPEAAASTRPSCATTAPPWLRSATASRKGSSTSSTCRWRRAAVHERRARAGRAAVVVLSHRIWRDLYGGDPAAVGKTFRVTNGPPALDDRRGGEPRPGRPAQCRLLGELRHRAAVNRSWLRRVSARQARRAARAARERDGGRDGRHRERLRQSRQEPALCDPSPRHRDGRRSPLDADHRASAPPRCCCCWRA